MAKNTDSNRTKVLHKAAKKGDLDTIKGVLKTEKGDINPGSINPSVSNGETVLHVAAQYGRLNVVSFYTKNLTDENSIHGWRNLIHG